MASSTGSTNRTTRSTTTAAEKQSVAEVVDSLAKALVDLKGIKEALDTSNTTTLETRVAAAEARASVAEVRASVAELRTTLAHITSELVEQRDVLNTIIDSIADLRNDFQDFTDHTHAPAEEDD